MRRCPYCDRKVEDGDDLFSALLSAAVVTLVVLAIFFVIIPLYF